MVTVTVNVLWVIVVLAIIIAFALAIRRRRLASRERQPEPYVHRVYSRQLETVLVHRESNAHPSSTVYTQPPAFDPVQPPPPSYQDYQKDTRIQHTDQQQQ